MRDLKFACPHCEQHIKCEDNVAGQTINCPACGGKVVVPKLPDEHHLRITTGKVPIPTHAHGAPRAATGQPVQASGEAPSPEYSKLAVASLALSCGSVLLGPFGCIPGILFGHLAQAELRRRPQLQGANLAKTGLIVGYCFLPLCAAFTAYIIMRLLNAHQP